MIHGLNGQASNDWMVLVTHRIPSLLCASIFFFTLFENSKVLVLEFDIIRA